ncbi:hypothetical protein A1O3_02726 [Capronia epimyces CBS 606.96]|uniref:Uncharacterized protein n=1 Tax=Capronia epimyces CBS 606.96 TaxID=1182542 RepID=W9Z581_9EURO|nr:uncharacterized protein A1O3_02726 [Capronia epimyces CBS 606.96]EXJ89659.1 hypothetical protein A1O3_02726 [Capronia epimyces CBS 606.96]
MFLSLWLVFSPISEITLKDPATHDGSIAYATYYSFFEAFPLVYLGTYNMSLGAFGLIFTNITAGCIVGLTTYWIYLRCHFLPRAMRYHEQHGEPVSPKQWLRPGLLGVWDPPASLFLPAAISFCIFRSLSCYMALTYPKHVASLFAANEFARSMLAASFVQFTRQMYLKLGIGCGVTLVAGLSCIGIVGIGMYALYHYGALPSEKQLCRMTPTKNLPSMGRSGQ